ncbi:MAG TPA: iron uptake transporter permease EfeU [Jatrophihabitans sp.]|nr:iron uptake transporter permease EfeU [Jatrophihabitans sp.]
MTWADAAPNLLIGLREGLEAGLVVSILLAALRKTAAPDRRVSSTPIWLGVLGAVTLSAGFAAVLTFSTSVLSSRAQQAVGGVLSVLAVGLVTAMIFWMRRTAAALSGELRGRVQHAALVGASALALTAFLAVGREGLETTLFLWTAVQASGQTVAPLVGAGVGLAAAVLLCALLYRQAVRLNLGVFFNRTAIALIVIAAGVFAYGLGDLQEAGLVSGQQWVGFDVSAHVDPGSWWMSIISGVTELTPRMTWLQVAGWLSYLAVVLPAFWYAGRHPAPVVQRDRSASGRFERAAGRRPWATAGALVAVPAIAAGATIALLPAAAASATVTVTRRDCAKDWTAAESGIRTFTVRNESGRAGEINLVDSAGAIVGEIETLGPATSAELTATLGTGSYTFRCLLSGQPVTTSAAVQVSGGRQPSTPAVKPVSVADVAPPNRAYVAYAAGILAREAADVARLEADLRRGHLAAARTDWLTAQLDWERVGASYNSFGADGVAADGLPDGLPKGVDDPGFTGLHRLEYGLWHGQPAAELLPVAAELGKEIATIRANLTSDDLAGDPTNLPLRAHEILEDALRDHLSGIDDQGAGAAYPMTYADTQVTRVVIGELAPLLDARAPGLVAQSGRLLDALQDALLATRSGGGWRAAQQVPLAQRQAVNAAIGAALETLDRIPTLLEVPPTH